MMRTSNSVLLLGFLLLPGCVGPFAPEPGALHLRVYNETPSGADIRLGLMQGNDLQFDASMTLPGHNQTRAGLPPSDRVEADLDAGRYKVEVTVNSRPCPPRDMHDPPEGWGRTVGSINHVVGAIWAVTIMPDVTCKIGKEATA